MVVFKSLHTCQQVGWKNLSGDSKALMCVALVFIDSFIKHLLWTQGGDFPGGLSGKEPACQGRRRKQETWVPSCGKIPLRRKIPWREDPLEEEMPTHSNILAWKTNGQEEPGGLQSVGSQSISHDLTHAWTQVKSGIF